VRAAFPSQLCAAALAAYLLWSALFAWRRWRNFRQSAAPAKRERLFRRILLRNALLLAAAAVAADAPALGLRPPAYWDPIFLSLVTSALVVSTVLLLATQKGRAIRDQLLSTMGDMLPRTPAERRLFAVVALQAGPVEEILYRGFLLAFLGRLGVASPVILIAINGVMFGLVHWYQKLRGILLTGVLGALFTWVTLETGSIYLAVLVHTMVDVRGLVLVLSAREAPATS
jgi:membrane protease YdiL (CAAX protease family)